MKHDNQIANISAIYENIREVLDRARSTVYQAANFAMVQAYWNVGRIIVEEEQKGQERAEYGSGLIRELSARLTHEFGKGFSKRNLWHIRSIVCAFDPASGRWRMSLE